jgi:hypothetical protein
MAVEYNQHTWGYGEELTPDKFNNIEGGVKATAEAVNEVNNNLNISSLEMGTATTSTEGQATIYYSKTHDRPADIIIATALSAHNVVRIVQITGSYNDRFLVECWNDSFKNFVNCTFSYLAIWNKA